MRSNNLPKFMIFKSVRRGRNSCIRGSFGYELRTILTKLLKHNIMKNSCYQIQYH